MSRSFWIEGRATPIIETSSASRNSAPQSTSRVPQARLVSLSLAPNDVMAVVLADTNQLLLRYCSTRTVLVSSTVVKQTGEETCPLKHPNRADRTSRRSTD